MIRDILRTIGTGCILAGGILYFTNGSDLDSNANKQSMQDEVKKLQNELAKAKEELAIAQTASSVESKKVNDDNKQDGSLAKNDPSSSNVIIKHVLTIDPGSNSTIVSATLERMGVIKNAAEFDTYLADNGLSGRIQIGEHEVDSSMDYSSIAKIITTNK